MHTHTIGTQTLRARTSEALFRKVARALGGNDYVARFQYYTEAGALYQVEAITFHRNKKLREIHGRTLVQIKIKNQVALLKEENIKLSQENHRLRKKVTEYFEYPDLHPLEDE
jgi:hypothetical protein